jgi:hypothetical protein
VLLYASRGGGGKEVEGIIVLYWAKGEDLLAPNKVGLIDLLLTQNTFSLSLCLSRRDALASRVKEGDGYTKETSRSFAHCTCSHWAGQERGTFWYLATTNPCLQRFAHAPRMRSLTRPGVQSEREGGGREWQGERKM